MASGMTYTMTETTALSTAEYYGKALCELGAPGSGGADR